MCFFSIWKNICQKEELCNTSVGCSWLLCKVCNPEKWCLLVKGSCASSLPAQLFSRCLSEQRTRTRDLQALCAEATLPLCFWSSRAVSQRSFFWCSKRSHIVQFQLHRSRDTLVLCGTHRETLCLFEFLCDNFTVHSFKYPTVPHLLQLYHMMQDLRGRMQRSVMQDVGWAGHEGHVSWAVVCRSSVALCAVDFFHCSTVGARDCFSAVEFIGKCSFRTSMFVGTSFVCEDHSMLETLGWRRRAVAGAGNWYSNMFEYIGWLSMMKFDHGCFTFFSYLDIVGHFFAATIVFWYFYTLSGSVHLWQSCTVASSLKKDRSWNGFALWGFETWSPRNVEYFMLCKQSKEERVQQMYQDNPRQTLQINTIK